MKGEQCSDMKYENFSDADLLKRCAHADEKAFEALLSRYEKQVYNIALYKLKSREDAEDAVQDTFIRLWRGAGSYRGGSASAFIYTVAKNAVTDILRRRGDYTVSLSSEDGDGEAVEMQIADTDDTPEEAAMRQEDIKTVKDAIEALPEHQREVIILYDILGKSYAEIAETLSLDMGTVKSRLSRGRQSLKKLIENFVKHGNKDG